MESQLFEQLLICSLFRPEPGPVRSLTVEPDIVSVMVSWEPPELGRDYITVYNISWLSGDDVIGYDEVDGGTTSYRITGLEPETTYMVIVRAFTSAGAGMTSSETAITNEIGEFRFACGNLLGQGNDLLSCRSSGEGLGLGICKFIYPYRQYISILRATPYCHIFVHTQDLV